MNPAPETSGLLEAFNPGAIPVAAAWIIGTLIAVRLMTRLLQRVSEKFSSRRLLLKQATALMAFAAYVVAFILAFNTLFNLSSEAIFALSGTIAVTVGFALKDVMASFLAGISILISKPFQVGDRITFRNYYGEVKEIGLRSVRVVTLDDNLVTVPSNAFLTEAVANANAGSLDCMVVIDFHITSGADHNRAKEIVHDAVVSSKYLYLGKPYTVLVSTRISAQGISYVVLSAKAYVYDMRKEKDFASDVTDRTLTAFREHGVPMAGTDVSPSSEQG